jgi:alpha-1,3-mannosyltransferase
MKILQVTRQFYPEIGGIQNVVLGLSEALLEVGYEVDVVTLDFLFSSKIKLDPISHKGGITIYRIPFWGGKRYPVAPKVIKFLWSYDVIHIHAIDFFVDFIALLRIFHKKPIVVTTHGGVFHTKWLYRFKQFYFSSVTKLTLSNVDSIICNSNHDLRLFKGVAPESKVSLIENGVSIEPFLKTKKNIQPGLLVGIGRIAENKGISKLIKIISILKPDFPEIKLVWIGGDPKQQIPSLQEYAKLLGVSDQLEFFGKVSLDEILEQLSSAQAFVSASSYEAFGLSTIEAMSSATLPLVTPVGVHPDIVQVGHTGFLFEPDSLAESIEIFRRVLKLDIAKNLQIGENARNAVLKYSWQNIVKAHIDIYEKLSGELD